MYTQLALVMYIHIYIALMSSYVASYMDKCEALYHDSALYVHV